MMTGCLKSGSLTYAFQYIPEGSLEVVMSRIPDLWTSPILRSNYA